MWKNNISEKKRGSSFFYYYYYFLTEDNKKYCLTRRNPFFRFLPDFEIFKTAVVEFCGV